MFFSVSLVRQLTKTCAYNQAAASPLSHLEPGTRFQPVIDDPIHSDIPSVQRIILHTGKLHYDLLKAREAHGAVDKVALIRIEELAPFPYEALQAILEPYGSAGVDGAEVYWLQEEPRNQGAWTHVAPRIASVLEKLEWDGAGSRIEYRGRKEDSVAATGIGEVYKREQAEVIESAFRGL